MELAESGDGRDGKEGLGTEQGLVVTSRNRKEGQGRPPAEKNRLLHGKERDRWVTGGRGGLGRAKSENQGGWRPKRDNPWDTQDREGIRAQLNAPRKEQRCVQEHHRKVLRGKRAGNRRLGRRRSARALRPLQAREEEALEKRVAGEIKERIVVRMRKDEVRFLNPTVPVPKSKGKGKKVVDCSAADR
jgi:hypothetical protein